MSKRLIRIIKQLDKTDNLDWLRRFASACWRQVKRKPICSTASPLEKMFARVSDDKWLMKVYKKTIRRIVKLDSNDISRRQLEKFMVIAHTKAKELPLPNICDQCRLLPPDHHVYIGREWLKCGLSIPSSFAITKETMVELCKSCWDSV